MINLVWQGVPSPGFEVIDGLNYGQWNTGHELSSRWAVVVEERPINQASFKGGLYASINNTPVRGRQQHHGLVMGLKKLVVEQHNLSKIMAGWANRSLHR